MLEALRQIGFSNEGLVPGGNSLASSRRLRGLQARSRDQCAKYARSRCLRNIVVRDPEEGVRLPRVRSFALIMPRFHSANGYWLGLSAAYGATLALVTALEWPWPWLLTIFGALLVFLVIHAWLYGQLGRALFTDLDPGKDSGLAILTIFPVLALLVRGSPTALWGGPALGVIACAVSYVCLKKYGYFRQRSCAHSSGHSD